jgi:predicted dehydrogenase
MSEQDPLRIGTLGAARIAPMALLRPARRLPGVEVVAIAARDPGRARKFAEKHGVPRVHPSYDALLEDPEIDAVYNPLPNGLHCDWTIRALEAGKHVLCEKPLASNEEEAQRMAAAAERSGRILAEAFHWRYHPLAARMQEVVESGVLGKIRHVEANVCIPLPLPRDIRYRYDLAGGATMDTGCYAISIVRFLAGAEPEVVRAEARLCSPEVDRWLRADLRFSDGRSGRITCSLLSAQLIKVNATVDGEHGRLHVINPVAPHFYHRLTVRTPEVNSAERVKSEATYTHQLRAFLRWVREGIPMATDAANGVANMRVIDAAYTKAGLTPRGTKPRGRSSSETSPSA